MACLISLSIWHDLLVLSVWQKELNVCIFIAPVNVPAMKYMESKKACYMERNHITEGALSLIFEWVMQNWPLFMHSFLKFMTYSTFWGFIHNTPVITDSNSQLHERKLILFIANVFGSNQHAFEPWNWMLNLLIKYWPFKCKNKCFLKCLPQENLIFSQLL